MKELTKPEITHITPVKDLKPHLIAGTGCDCHPQIEVFYNGNILVSHNAYDKRESLEEDNERFGGNH